MNRRDFLIGAFALSAPAMASAKERQPAQAASLPSTTPSSLVEYLSAGNPVLGYQVRRDAGKIDDNVYDHTAALIIDGGAQIFQMQELSRLSPGESFTGHVAIGRDKSLILGNTIHIERPPTNEEYAAVLNTLQSWAASGTIRHLKGGTFVSDKINDVISGPQQHIEYKADTDIQTAADFFRNGVADCKSFALFRYHLLQALAEKHMINASVDDVFMLALASKISPDTGKPFVDSAHVIVGYYDRSRGALFLIDGTGFERDPATGIATPGRGYLLEDTEKGRARMLELLRTDISPTGVETDLFVPVYLFTKTGTFRFDIVDKIDPNGEPIFKEPHFISGKEKPVASALSGCHSDYTSYLEIAEALPNRSAPAKGMRPVCTVPTTAN